MKPNDENLSPLVEKILEAESKLENLEFEIEEIGLRPGEKLYEELLISGDPESTNHPRIFKAHEDLVTEAQIQEQLQNLRQIILNKDHALLVQSLKEMISGYRPGSTQ